MTTELGFEIDLAAFQREQALRERELLDLARRQPKDKCDRGNKPDEAAALELLLKFAQFGRMNDPQVQEAMLDGAREVAGYVATQTLLQKGGEAPQIHPLMFFNGVSSPGKRGVKNKMSVRLSLAAAYGDVETPGTLEGVPMLDLSDLRKALTAPHGARRPKNKWPTQMHRVEKILIDYVRSRHKNASPEAAKCYVHASFALPWWEPDAVFTYPENW